MHDEEDNPRSTLDFIFSAFSKFSRAGTKRPQNSRSAAPRAGTPPTLGSTAAPIVKAGCCIAKRPGQK